MAVHLVTGYAGTPHVTAENDGQFNAFVVGDDRYLLSPMAYTNITVEADDTAQAAIATIGAISAKGVLNGRYFEITEEGPFTGTSCLTAGAKGTYLPYILVGRYSFEEETGIESMIVQLIEKKDELPYENHPSTGQLKLEDFSLDDLQTTYLDKNIINSDAAVDMFLGGIIAYIDDNGEAKFYELTSKVYNKIEISSLANLTGFTGTAAEVEEAISNGIIKEGMIVRITDDEDSSSAFNIKAVSVYFNNNNCTLITSNNVQKAITEIDSLLNTVKDDVSSTLTTEIAGLKTEIASLKTEMMYPHSASTS